MFEGKISQARESVPSFFKERIYALILCLKIEEGWNKAIFLALKMPLLNSIFSIILTLNFWYDFDFPKML